jgi:hypothetical protein
LRQSARFIGAITIQQLKTSYTEDRPLKKKHRGSRRKRPKPVEPRLGICWLLQGKLLFDSLPLSESAQYHKYRIYPGSHIAVWEEWQRLGKAPTESEYEEFPRARLTYDTSTKIFTLLADQCILQRKDVIATIREEFHLPKRITLGTDSHYRCFHCLYGSVEKE